MSKEWLSTQSFERIHRLIYAINTISIHSKLEMAGVHDPSSLPAVDEARQHLLRFLQDFEPVLANVERDQDQLSVGVDPRLGHLARGLAQVRRQRPRASKLASVTLSELRNFLVSEDASGRQTLIECLRDLRQLLEEHMHADVVSILGEL